MSGSVAEFMEKDVQKYACGEKARQAKKVLTAAFTASDSRKQKEESAEFERLISQVMKTDKGRDTLIELSELGYTFAFETGDYGGFCEATSKKIVVNPTFGDAYAMQTIVHEGQHAIQSAHEPENTPNVEQMTVASLLRHERAMEADACAHESAFIYQCRDVLPEVYAEAEKNDMPMFRAFVAEMDKSGDEKKAMRASFQAWYGYKKYQNAYEKQFQPQILRNAAKREKTGERTVSLSNPDIAGFCRSQGKPYISPEFFDRAENLAVSREMKDALAATGDKTVAALPVRGEKSALPPVLSKAVAAARGR